MHTPQLYIWGECLSDNDREYQAQLDRMIKRYKIEHKVQFQGWIDNPSKIISSLDVYVSSSLGEGLPGAVREAMAMYIPVVATDVGGTSEAIVDGQTGILVPPAQPELLASAIEKLINNMELAKSLVIAARQRVEKYFSVDSFVSHYAEVFDELVPPK